MTPNFQILLHAVPGRGAAKAAWVTTLIAVIRSLPDSLFAPDPFDDVFSIIACTKIGALTGSARRRAGLAEFLYVLAGFESSWDYACGEDMSAPRGRPAVCIETGAFQVSANAQYLDRSLPATVKSLLGTADTQAFITGNKRPEIAIPFVIALLRCPYKHWDGPINRGQVQEYLSPAAVDEYASLFAAA